MDHTSARPANAPRFGSDHDEDRRLRFMALGFGIGSTLFALGTVFVWVGRSDVLVDVTYALGAVGFTSAAFVQLRTAAIHEPLAAPGALLRSHLTNPDWMSAIIQFVGTLYFNVMTIRALLSALGVDREHVDQIWGPDVVGSLLFLISSWIAWHPVARRRRHSRLHGRSHVICLANMLGSVFFGLSAWGAWPQADGTVNSVAWSNWGTFLGALGFLVASVLLWPARTDSLANAAEPAAS